MIDVRDRVRLPVGVRVTAAGLHDDVRGETFELNETGRLVVTCADGRRLGEVAELTATRFGVAGEVALADVSGFCLALNERFLLNVESRPGAVLLRLLSSLARGLPLGALPAPPRRRARIDTTGAPAAVASTAGALALRALAVGVLAAAVAAVLLAGVGAPGLGPPVLLGLGTALALVVHEGAHAAALRGVPCCLCLAGTAVFLLHRPLPGRRRRLVAVAGPLAAAAGGLTALAVAGALGLAALGPAALVPLSHVVMLTVAGRDGRAACGLS